MALAAIKLDKDSLSEIAWIIKAHSLFEKYKSCLCFRCDVSNQWIQFDKVIFSCCECLYCDAVFLLHQATRVCSAKTHKDVFSCSSDERDKRLTWPSLPPERIAELINCILRAPGRPAWNIWKSLKWTFVRQNYRKDNSITVL